MNIETITTPDGRERIIMDRSDYEDLIDARDHARSMADIAAGAPTLTDEEVDAYLAARTPLAFWRKRAGLTQAALAERLGISQVTVAQLEHGHRIGTLAMHAKLAKLFGIRIEDLISDQDAST